MKSVVNKSASRSTNGPYLHTLFQTRFNPLWLRRGVQCKRLFRCNKAQSAPSREPRSGAFQALLNRPADRGTCTPVAAGGRSVFEVGVTYLGR
jgi:hypothetical protein